MPMTIREAQTGIQAILRQFEMDQGVVVSEIDLMQNEMESVGGGIEFVRTVRLKASPGPGAWAWEG